MPPFLHDRDVAPPKPAAHRRRRQRRSIRRAAVGPLRPGRIFRRRHRLYDIRRAMKPYHLGECDWLLYRRTFNPYDPTSFKSKAYARGFADSKRAKPKPTWRPIP